MGTSALKYALVALVIVMLAALAAWYFFLKGERATIEEGDLGRGAGVAAPFGIDAGSTYQNIVSSLSSIVGGDVESETSSTARLLQVGKVPIAGYNFMVKGDKTRLRFVERGSGYVFDVAPEGGALERVTNTLVPRTYEALIAGNRVVMRGIDESGAVTTQLADIASTSTPAGPAPLKSRRLVNDIREVALEQNGSAIVYIVETAAGGKGVRSSWDGKSEKQVFSSTIVGWQIHLLENGQLILTENAEDNITGRTYRINDGAFQGVVDARGLTFLPHPTLAAYLYGESAGAGPTLFARVSETSSPTSLPLRTVAEKCVFAPASVKAAQGKLAALVAYCAVPRQLPPPDFLGKWYRGEIHTADTWWKVDVRANSAEPLYASANATFDVEDPVIDSSGDYIAFRNAVDKTLWLLRIKE